MGVIATISRTAEVAFKELNPKNAIGDTIDKTEDEVNASLHRSDKIDRSVAFEMIPSKLRQQMREYDVYLHDAKSNIIWICKPTSKRGAGIVVMTARKVMDKVEKKELRNEKVN